MPSEMDLKRFSSPSYFSQDICLSNQVGFLKPDNPPDHNATGYSVTSSSMDKPGYPVPFPVNDVKGKYCLNGDIVAAKSASNHSFSLLSHGEGGGGKQTSLNVHPALNFVGSNKVDINGIQHESSLFSSSLSELLSRKLRLSANNAVYGYSVDTIASHFEEEEEEELFESLEELEAQTIRNLLPDDDDLLSGVTDGLAYAGQSSVEDDTEELDLFSSVGGMDLGDDGLLSGQRSSEITGELINGQLGMCNGSIAGKHPCGKHPSRTLFVRNINSSVEDPELRALFEQYGDIHTLYTDCKHRGFVMISYYDIRAAQNAIRALQNKPLKRRKLDIHYSIPKDNLSDKDINQGTLLVSNIDSSIRNDELQQIFGAYGEIKEIRETPHRLYHKIIEFYDVRAAESALHALNNSDIAGMQIKLEPSPHGGARWRLLQQIPPELEQDECHHSLQQSSSPLNAICFAGTGVHGMTYGSLENGKILGVRPAMQSSSMPFQHGISSSVPKSLPSLARFESVGNQDGVAESTLSLEQPNFDIWVLSTSRPHLLPDYHEGVVNGIHCHSPEVGVKIGLRPQERVSDRQTPQVNSNGHPVELNECVFKSSVGGSHSLPGNHYTWSNSYHPSPPHPPAIMWPNSPSFVNGISRAHPPSQLHGMHKLSSHMVGSTLPLNNHRIGSAPAVNPPIWDRHYPHSYAGGTPEASGFRQGSLGSMRGSNSSPHCVEFLSQDIFPQARGNCVDITISNNVGLQPHHQGCMMFPGRSYMIPMVNSLDSKHERGRSRRSENGLNQVDNKKQYELDINCIIRGEDNRTTLMIKNIPNKYTSKMLLAAIDECHKGTYDFIYLPIDFKNKCNVGYAFINMTDPALIIPFYQAFNGKKWEKFNSEKVASLAYARIQGKVALIAHFQNSSLMNEDKRCRPILFNTDGPNAGDQVPFPVGVNVRARHGRMRSSCQEDNQLRSPPGDGEECTKGEHSPKE